MKQGDKIIWDSGFGYDLGYYLRECDNQYHSTVVKMATGRSANREMCFSKDRVIPYTAEKLEELTEKYRYKQSKFERDE